MTVVTQNLGPVKAISIGTSPPSNTKMLWHDTNTNLPKYYNTNTATWDSLVASGTGTVTSVALSLPSIFTVSGSPVTSAGTLSASLANQSANTLFAGPSTGAAAAPTFRSLVVADIPDLSSTYYLASNPSSYISSAITSLNSLSSASQTLVNGTTGTDFNIASSGSTHTFNLPSSSALNRGLLIAADWTTFNNKFDLPALTSGSVLFSNGTTIAQDNANFFYDDTNNRLGLGTTTPSSRLHVVGSGSTSATYTIKVEDSTTNLNFSVRDDGQVAVGGGADAFYQMKINTSPTFIGGLFINNGARTGYCLELSGSVGHGAYITVPTNQNAIEVIAGRSQFGGIVGIGSAAQAASSLRVTSDGTFSTASCIRIESTASSGTHYGADIELSTAGTQIQYGVYLDVSGGATNYSLFSIAGNVNLQSIPIGNAGLVAGDLYKDTAANILANGDYVVGMKV